MARILAFCLCVLLGSGGRIVSAFEMEKDNPGKTFNKIELSMFNESLVKSADNADTSQHVRQGITQHSYFADIYLYANSVTILYAIHHNATELGYDIKSYRVFLCQSEDRDIFQQSRLDGIFRIQDEAHCHAKLFKSNNLILFDTPLRNARPEAIFAIDGNSSLSCIDGCKPDVPSAHSDARELDGIPGYLGRYLRHEADKQLIVITAEFNEPLRILLESLHQSAFVDDLEMMLVAPSTQLEQLGDWQSYFKLALFVPDSVFGESGIYVRSQGQELLHIEASKLHNSNALAISILSLLERQP